MKMCGGHHKFMGGRHGGGHHHGKRKGHCKHGGDMERRGGDMGRRGHGPHGHHHGFGHRWGSPQLRGSPPRGDRGSPPRRGASPGKKDRRRGGSPTNDERELIVRFLRYCGAARQFPEVADRPNPCRCREPLPEQGTSGDRREPECRPPRASSAPPTDAIERRGGEFRPWERFRGMKGGRGRRWERHCC